MTATTTIAVATKPIDISVSICSVPGEWGAKARPSYTRALMRSPSPAISGARVALRAGAAGARGRRGGGSAAAPEGAGSPPRRRSPPARRARWRSPSYDPRTHGRDVALFAMQMWAFTDGPRASLRRPGAAPRAASAPATRSSSTARSALAGSPTSASSGPSRGCRGSGAQPRPHLGPLALVPGALPGAALHPPPPPRRFPRAARRLAAVFDVGCVVYFAVPTAPPWWASEQGLTGEEVRRIMAEVGEGTWRSAWPRMYAALGGNPWAAMPSLHFATALVVADLAGRSGQDERARVGWAYALTLGFALVYLGEHYVTDLAAGAALVVAVRRGGAARRTTGRGVNRRLQRLERIANG